MNIKKWYLDTYKDELGLEINDNCNFNDMDHYEVRHIYEYLYVLHIGQHLGFSFLEVHLYLHFLQVICFDIFLFNLD
jgi:hypothetical protein